MPFIVSYHDLYREHAPLSAARATYNQQAHILIADRVIISHIPFNPTHSSDAFKSIVITAIEVLIILGTETIITLINSKEIIVIKIIVLRTGILSSLLFGIN